MKRFTQLVACVMCSLMMSAGPDQPMNLGARAVTAAPLAEGSEPSRVDATQGLAALDQRALFVQTVGQIGGGSHSVDVEGTHACLTMGPRLLILDVSNPSAPRQEGQTDAFPHQLSNVFFKDGYCYVTDWDVLRIIDVIDPSEPRVVGTYDSPGSPIDVQVVGKYAYVAALGEGLRIVDVTDPKQPKEVGFYKGGAGSAGAVKVVGQHAYVAYRSAGLKIVDVSDPTKPREVGSLPLTDIGKDESAVDVDVADGFAYVAAFEAGLWVVDVTTPSRPTGVASMATALFSDGVKVAKNRLYLTDAWTFRIIDISSPSAPSEIGSHFRWGKWWYGPYNPHDVDIVDNIAYLPGRFSGLEVVDVSTPASLGQSVKFETVGRAERLAMRDGYAYISGGDRLWTVNVRDPQQLASTEGGLASIDYRVANDLVVSEGRVFVAGEIGLQVYDLSEPSKPKFLKTFRDLGPIRGVSATKTHAFLVTGVGGLHILDIVNLNAISEVGVGTKTAGVAHNIEVVGQYAFIADGDAGLTIVDILDPTAPRVVQSVPTSRSVEQIEVVDGKAYVGGGNMLHIIDVSSPGSASMLGSFPHSATRFQVANGHAYLISNGLTIVDVSNPANVQEVGYIRSADFSTDVAVDGDLIYLADGHGGLWSLRYVGPNIGDTCETAAPAPLGVDNFAQLANASDVDVFKVEVPTPFTRIQVLVDDPNRQLDLNLFRACISGGGGLSAGTGTGRHIGTGTGRHIGDNKEVIFNVLSQIGTYYVEVRRRPGSNSAPLPYSLNVTLEGNDADEVSTLIITDRPMIETLYDTAQVQSWATALRTLADHPAVRGKVVWSLEDDTNAAVRQAYTDWKKLYNTPQEKIEATNTLARVLRDWIWDIQRRSFPSLRYIVIAGDDRFIPHLRVKVKPTGDPPKEWGTEREYRADGGIAGNSDVGTALTLEYTLTDDVYSARASDDQATLRAAAEGFTLSELYVPELAVGRLVESPSDMTAVIQAYLGRSGGLGIRRSLVAGYHFMQDSTARADRHLDAAGIVEPLRTRFLDNAWTASQLTAKLFGERHELAFLAVHASHYYHETPNDGRVQVGEVQAASADLRGTVVYALACHGGLSIPGVVDHDHPVDFPEAWLGKGAMYIGSTGWVYGLDNQLVYQEELMADFTANLIAGSGSAIGDALASTKMAFYEDHKNELDAMHAKSLVGTILYGLPMYRVAVQNFRGVRPPIDLPPPPLPVTSASPQPLDPQVAVRRGQRYTFVDNEMVHQDTPEGTEYFVFGGQRPLAKDGEPIQPQYIDTVYEVESAGEFLPPRGTVMTGARYRDIANFRPATYRAGPLGAMQRPSAQDPVVLDPQRWYPSILVGLNRLDKTPGTGPVVVGQEFARLAFTLGQYQPRQQVERLYQEIQLDEYYSAAVDKTPPEFVSVRGWADERFIDLVVRVRDASGIERVIVAFTSNRGTWSSSQLTWNAVDETWVGRVPADSVSLIQAVDRAGNVAVDGHAGRLYDADNIPSIGVAYIPYFWTERP